jgi:hypothetical protein
LTNTPKVRSEVVGARARASEAESSGEMRFKLKIFRDDVTAVRIIDVDMRIAISEARFDSVSQGHAARRTR